MIFEQMRLKKKQKNKKAVAKEILHMLQGHMGNTKEEIEYSRPFPKMKLNGSGVEQKKSQVFLGQDAISFDQIIKKPSATMPSAAMPKLKLT